jgi:diguanylate cyclase (GGDEF)-like protein
MWERALQEETARTARSGRPVTIVIAELPRLDDVVARLGQDAADRAVAETARRLVAESRASDQVAKIDDARFGVLMPETDETRAREYVDRVQAAADEWLGQAGLAVHLSVGWASPTEDHDVAAAAALAQRRMREPEEPPVAGAPDRGMKRDLDEGLSTTK